MTGEPTQQRFLVFGGTGQTGQHFVELALAQGHQVRVLARNPAALTARSPRLEIVQGAIPDVPDLDNLLHDVDHVVVMVGDVQAQRTSQVNAAFLTALIPAMRRQGVVRLLYQAGALSAAPGQHLPPLLWAIRKTVAHGFDGQHRDNEAVMRYLADTAGDIEWMVHRAGIGSDGPSKGVLERSRNKFSVATFRDCAAYNYRLITDETAVHTCDFSHYAS